ncbi:MAG: tRNA-Thr(GGU) m(6)t(6)A37 methyltransferase TsaA [Oleiphilaceae bacterium]|jgi:tRNA-Thr(GGU) m(6)t(6)A37 methyltransferase TsaA
MLDSNLTIKPIGIVHSPFKEKFGIPRQASLIKSCSATVELLKPFCSPDSVKGLNEFSDIWLIFSFHQNNNDIWRPLVRPPRLGGNEKTGVFASRSPFRPNSLGLSRVELREIVLKNNKASLRISCPDIVDGTPIYDIKPYIHYADSNSDALCGFAQEAPDPDITVKFKPNAVLEISKLELSNYKNLKDIIIEVLKQGPCPAYKNKNTLKRYGFSLFDLNIVWTQIDKVINVEQIQKS